MFKILLFILLLPSLVYADGLVIGWPAGGSPDGFIGNDAAGTEYAQGDPMQWTSYVTTTAGTVSYIHFRLAEANAAGSVNGAIYSAGGTKLQDGTSVHPITQVATQQIDITLDSPVILSAATTYTLVFAHDNQNTPSVFYGTGSEIWYYEGTFPADIDTLVTTLPTADGNVGANPLIIWADNSPN